MKNVAAFVVLMMLSTAVAAQEWRRLSGVEIETALAGHSLDYDNGDTQSFSAAGDTHYFATRPSLGYWGVRGDQYCSVWPPSDIWNCYHVEQWNQMIRFIDSNGEISQGRFSD